MPVLMPTLTWEGRIGFVNLIEVIQIFEDAVIQRDNTGGAIVINMMDVLLRLGEEPDMPIDLGQVASAQDRIQKFCVSLAEMCGWTVSEPATQNMDNWTLILIGD